MILSATSPKRFLSAWVMDNSLAVSIESSTFKGCLHLPSPSSAQSSILELLHDVLVFEMFLFTHSVTVWVINNTFAKLMTDFLIVPVYLKY